MNIVEYAHLKSSFLFSKHIGTILKNIITEFKNKREMFAGQEWRGVEINGPDFKTCPRKGFRCTLNMAGDQRHTPAGSWVWDHAPCQRTGA